MLSDYRLAVKGYMYQQLPVLVVSDYRLAFKGHQTIKMNLLYQVLVNTYILY